METEDRHGREGDDGEREKPKRDPTEWTGRTPEAPLRVDFDDPMRPTIYSAPRRFDIATVLTVMAAYALLFTAMRLLGWEPATLGVVGGFVTAVGIGQALLFGGNAPRIASVVVGAAYWAFAVTVASGGNVCLGFSSLFWGGVSGYVAGTLVGGVFLVADAVRRGTFDDIS